VGYPQIMVKTFGGKVKTFGTVASTRFWAALHDPRLFRPRRTTTAQSGGEAPRHALKGQNFWEHVSTLYVMVERALGCFDFVNPLRPR
jgi:hypothetical protein